MIIIMMSTSTTMGTLVRNNARILIITHVRNEILKSTKMFDIRQEH